MEQDNLNPKATEGQPESPESKKIFGKYETPEAAEQGYWNAVEMGNTAKEQLSMAMRVIEQLQASGPPQVSTPVTPAYEKALSDMGIPVDPVRELIRSEAQKIAGETIKKQLNPMVEGAQAQSYMEATYSDYRDNVGNVMKFVKTKPELARRFDALLDGDRPTEALELAYLHWKNSGATPKPSQETEAAKRAAAAPQGAAGAGRTSGMQTGPSQQELDDAYKAYYGGNAVPLINLKLGNMPMTYTEQLAALMRGNQ